MGTEEDAPDGSLVVVPKSEMIEEDEEQEEEDAPDGSLVVVPKSDMAEEDDDDQDESASSPKSDWLIYLFPLILKRDGSFQGFFSFFFTLFS